MRIFLAFLFSLISYSLVLLFFIFIFSQKPKTEEKVFVHTAIVTKNFSYKRINRIKKSKKSSIQKIKKIIKNKAGSKSSFTKGGNVNFNDIFKNVKNNVPTKQINLKKNLNLSRFKGNIKNQLNKLKNINIDISYSAKSNSNKGKINELINKIYQIWNNISYIPGEYATIKFINQNGNISVLILKSNLDEEKQKELISQVQNIKFNKNIEIIIKFQTKVHK